jgi:hypothetical protein
MQNLKALGTLLLFPVFLPLYLAKFLGETSKISWKIWSIQVLWVGLGLYGFLDWFNGWTPDPIIPPETYNEPSGLECDPRFYASANSC